MLPLESAMRHGALLLPIHTHDAQTAPLRPYQHNLARLLRNICDPNSAYVTQAIATNNVIDSFSHIECIESEQKDECHKGWIKANNIQSADREH